MEITFLGVGEAFDETQTTTALLVRHAGKTVLLDCGYSTPHDLWNHNADPNHLTAVYLSHYHPDHAFGIVPYLMRLPEDGRTQPLHIIGQNDIKTYVTTLLDLAQPQFTLDFPIVFHTITSPVTLDELTFHGAATTHSRKNYAVRIETADTSLVYMGDGDFTNDTIALSQHADLLIVNCKYENNENPAHASLEHLTTYLPKLTAKRIALVHIARHLRPSFLTKTFTDNRLFIPAKGDTLPLG